MSRPGTRAVRVDAEVYAALLVIKADLERTTGRPASLNDAARSATDLALRTDKWVRP